jgi:hypothetical protein
MSSSERRTRALRSAASSARARARDIDLRTVTGHGAHDHHGVGAFGQVARVAQRARLARIPPGARIRALSNNSPPTTRRVLLRARRNPSPVCCPGKSAVLGGRTAPPFRSTRQLASRSLAKAGITQFG